MCIRDRTGDEFTDLYLVQNFFGPQIETGQMDGGLSLLLTGCLLYTSDAADERSSVDLGGRRIIKKKNSGWSAGT